MTQLQNGDALISASASMLTIQDAVLDSPIFRANVTHIEDQVDQIQLWLEGLTKQLKLYLDELNKFNMSTNALCKKAIPQGIDESLLDSDFTSGIIRSFTDALQTSLAFKSKLVTDVEEELLQPLTQFLKADVKEFKEYRKQMEKQLSLYESQLAKYSVLSKTKEASALREDAFQLHEVRKAYVRMCNNYVTHIIAFRTYLDRVIVTSFTGATVAHVEDLEGAHEVWQKLKTSIGAWRRWLIENRQTCDFQLQKLQKTRKRIEHNYLKQIQPSRDLDHYNPSTTPVTGSGAIASLTALSPSDSAAFHKQKLEELVETSSKQGYLFNRIVVGKPARYSWVRKWFFLHDGWFGSCTVGTTNKIKGTITVNDRVSVLLCDIKVVSDLDRRFCFEIVCAQQPSFMLQAETEEDMQIWITAFNSSKRLALENTYGENSSQSEKHADGEKSASLSKSLNLVSSKAKSTTVVTTDASFPSTATSTTILPSGETATTTSIVTPSIQASGYFPKAPGKNFMSTRALSTSSSLTSLLVRDVSKDNLHRSPTGSPVIGSNVLNASVTTLSGTANKEDEFRPSTPGQQTPGDGQNSTWGIPWALVPGINMFSNPAEAGTEAGNGASPIESKSLVVWPAHIDADVEKVNLSGYDTSMEAKNQELRRLFGGVGREEVVVDAFLASLHRPASTESTEPANDDPPMTPVTPSIPDIPIKQDTEIQDIPLSSYGHAYTGRAFLTQDTFWFYSCMMMTCVNTIAVKLKDIQAVRLVRDPSVAGHGSGTKDDIALSLTIKEGEETTQFVLKTLMHDVEAVAERMRLAIDNAKSGHGMPLQDLYDIIQNIAVSRSRSKDNQPTTIISTSKSSQIQGSSKVPTNGSEATLVDKSTTKDKKEVKEAKEAKSKKAPRKTSSGIKPMPATSGALAAAMMAATAVAGGSKFFDESQMSKKPEEINHATPHTSGAESSADTPADTPTANTSDADELPANVKEPSGPVSCDCKDHLDKLEGEIEVPVSAKKLFEYLFSDEQTGPSANGGAWNKMNTSKGNSGLSVTKWSNNGEGKPERVLKYIMPVNNPMVKVKDTEVVETQTIVKQDSHLCYVVTASTKTAQLPYADAFVPCLRFCITWVSKKKCKLTCHIGVKWLKSIMVKSMVNKAALKGMGDTIAALLPIVKADAQRLGQPAGKVSSGEADMKEVTTSPTLTTEDVQSKEEATSKKVTQESSYLSWIPNLQDLSITQIVIAAFVLTLLIYRWQTSAPSDKNSLQQQVIYSRAVYLQDIEKDLINTNPTLNASQSVDMFLQSRPTFADTPGANGTLAQKASTWFTSYHRHFAYELSFTRERLGLLRYDLMVVFQTLNNIEKRLLETEYVNWLLDGQLRCASEQPGESNNISCDTVDDQLAKYI